MFKLKTLFHPSNRTCCINCFSSLLSLLLATSFNQRQVKFQSSNLNNLYKNFCYDSYQVHLITSFWGGKVLNKQRWTFYTKIGAASWVSLFLFSCITFCRKPRDVNSVSIMDFLAYIVTVHCNWSGYYKIFSQNAPQI